MANSMFQWVLNEDDFRHLVAGENLELPGAIELSLGEMGIDEMFMALRHAMVSFAQDGSAFRPGQLPRECEFCDNKLMPILMRLGAHPTSMRQEVAARETRKLREEYVACPNCLLGLVTNSLTSAQFLRAKEKGGDVSRWYLHEDFYDGETGEALQPKMPGLAARR